MGLGYASHQLIQIFSRIESEEKLKELFLTVLQLSTDD